MNKLEFGPKFKEENVPLFLEGNKLPSSSRSGMTYSWIDKNTGKIYNRNTSDTLEITFLTERNYHNMFKVEGRLSTDRYGGYYGSRYESNVSVRITIDEELIQFYREKSDAIRAYISKLFENIPSYGSGVYPKVDDKSILPNVNPINQPETFKVKLLEYQKKSVSKMISIENNSSEMKLNYKYTIDFGDKLKISYDPKRRVYLSNDDTNKYEILVSTKGGILADEMGLGKTITSLALVALNPSRYNFDIDYSNPNNYVKDFKINTKATLIVVPAHITKQWVDEFKRVFPKSNVIKLLDKRSHTPLKYKDIIEADAVIVTQQFLMNFKYYPMINYRQCTPSNYGSDERKQALKNVISNWTKTNENIYEKLQPNLEHFNFHRLIVDEGHEIFGLQLTSASMSEYMSDWLSNCTANYKWFVSGTPFVTFNGVVNCLKFIDCKFLYDGAWKNYDSVLPTGYRYHYGDSNTEENSRIFSKKYLIDQLLNNIMIRHREIDTDTNLLGYEEETIWVNLTDFEKKIYDSKKGSTNTYNDGRKLLQQLCCHILATDSIGQLFDNKEVNLNEIEDKLIELNKERIEKYEKKIKLLVQGTTEYFMLKKNYETKISECRYFLNALEKLGSSKESEKEETCSVCLDTIENRVITKCGHMFCKECLDMCLEQRNTCPYCKNDLKGTEIYLADCSHKKAEIETTNPLVLKYGSKLGKLISLARKLVIDENNKIIIFSQWDRMLNLIGVALKENGVSNSFIQGNVHRRNAAINKFKTNNKEDNVIMLSLEKSASGTNLTEATHILFVEPIDCERDEVKAIESQAIARACRIGQDKKIKVIRILTKDTIEEEIYNKHKVNDQNNENQDIILNENQDIILNEGQVEVIV